MPAIAENLSVGDVSKADTRKLKVTYVLGSLKDAGAERQAMELMRHLNRRRFAVSAIVMEGASTDQLGSIAENHEVLRISQSGNHKWIKRLPALLHATKRICECLNSWRPDIVHAFLSGPSILMGIATRIVRVPVTIGSRRSLPGFYRCNRGFFAARADTLAFHLADMNLGNSLAVSKEMVEVARCPARKCHTILNGVDLLRFRPDLPRALRQEMGWQANEIVIGMVANFRPCKRHTDFLDAAVITRNHYPNAKFVMVGADNGNRTEIAARIKALGLEQSVALLGSQNRPERIFAAIDIYICPSDTEGFSNVLLEALACGKPVIATRVGGNEEIIKEGDNGFLVPPRSPESIARALGLLLNQPSLRAAMGKRGRHFAEANFSLERMVQEHERLYTKLISEHGKEGR